MLDIVIQIRVQASVIAVIDEAARLQGKSRSAFMREAVWRRAQEVLSLGVKEPADGDTER